MIADYRSYIPEDSGRTREGTEWSIHYSYGAADTHLPRILLIGDSICNAYQSPLREKLTGVANVSFWASSKCVTDPDYFRELDFVLKSDRGGYSVICFNNGLHSLSTDFAAWENAYRAALRFLSDACPGSRHFALLSTPLLNKEQDDCCLAINAMTAAAAAAAAWPIIDLYGAMDCFDRAADMSDVVHWKHDAVEYQAEFLAQTIRSCLG